MPQHATPPVLVSPGAVRDVGSCNGCGWPPVDPVTGRRTPANGTVTAIRLGCGAEVRVCGDCRRKLLEALAVPEGVDLIHAADDRQVLADPQADRDAGEVLAFLRGERSNHESAGVALRRLAEWRPEVVTFTGTAAAPSVPVEPFAGALTLPDPKGRTFRVVERREGEGLTLAQVSGPRLREPHPDMATLSLDPSDRATAMGLRGERLETVVVPGVVASPALAAAADLAGEVEELGDAGDGCVVLVRHDDGRETRLAVSDDEARSCAPLLYSTVRVLLVPARTAP